MSEMSIIFHITNICFRQTNDLKPKIKFPRRVNGTISFQIDIFLAIRFKTIHKGITFYN